MAKRAAFWDDLARDLEDPEFRREFLAVARRLDDSPSDPERAEENRATHDRWIARGLNRAPSDPDYSDNWYAEQCGGCHWYRTLEGAQGADWGVCSSPESRFDGTVRFEHDGCDAFALAQPGAAPFS